MKYQQIAKLAKEQNFHVDRQKGSHEIWKDNSGKICIIPRHNGDIPKGTLRSIMKMLGILSVLVLVGIALSPEFKSVVENVAYQLYLILPRV